MRILWLCNLVLPDFCEEYGFKKNQYGGWMTGMLHQLEHDCGLEIALCFPIIKQERAKDFVHRGHRCYSFQSCQEGYNPEVTQRFIDVITDFKPDIIHIWGTEYPHALSMVIAGETLQVIDRIVVNIQGLVSVCSRHYISGIPAEYLSFSEGGEPTIEHDRDSFFYKGKFEEEVIKRVNHVIGRTVWDRACVLRINPSINYYFCNEILRDEFYELMGKWKIEDCMKHSIFVSQAFYPVKGFSYLLEALPDIRKRFPDVHVYVSGVDITRPCRWDTKQDNTKKAIYLPYGKYIMSLMEKYDLRKTITFTGITDAKGMCDLYLKAHVFVSASTIENESNAISEAKMIGTPVVASFVGGVPSRIVSNKDGFLYQCDAPYMLAYYINEIFGNAQLAKRLSEAASSDALVVNDKVKNSERNKEIYNLIYRRNQI